MGRKGMEKTEWDRVGYKRLGRMEWRKAGMSKAR